MTKVSICIPTYNDAISLKRCLDSIMIQNFRDFDVIITDDSNVDDVENLVCSYDFQEIKLQYYRNSPALQSPENWNESLRKAKGKYIKLLHHDDWFTYDFSLKILVDLIENNNAVIGFVSSRNVNLENNLTININTPSHSWIDQIRSHPIELISGNLIGAPSAIIHKNGLGIYYDKNLKWFVDVEFYINLLNNYNGTIELNDIDAISVGIGNTQISRECENNAFVIIFEFFYVLKKYKVKMILDYEVILKTTLDLFLRFNIKNTKKIRSFGYKEELPVDISKVLILFWKIKIKKRIFKLLDQIKK